MLCVVCCVLCVVCCVLCVVCCVLCVVCCVLCVVCCVLGVVCCVLRLASCVLRFVRCVLCVVSFVSCLVCCVWTHEAPCEASEGPFRQGLFLCAIWWLLRSSGGPVRSTSPLERVRPSVFDVPRPRKDGRPSGSFRSPKHTDGLPERRGSRGVRIISNRIPLLNILQ